MKSFHPGQSISLTVNTITRVHDRLLSLSPMTRSFANIIQMHHILSNQVARTVKYLRPHHLTIPYLVNILYHLFSPFRRNWNFNKHLTILSAILLICEARKGVKTAQAQAGHHQRKESDFLGSHFLLLHRFLPIQILISHTKRREQKVNISICHHLPNS